MEREGNTVTDYADDGLELKYSDGVVLYKHISEKLYSEYDVIRDAKIIPHVYFKINGEIISVADWADKALKEIPVNAPREYDIHDSE